MRWVLTWKPFDGHPQGRQSKESVHREFEIPASKGCWVEGVKDDVVETEQHSTMQSWDVLTPSPRSSKATDTRCKPEAVHA